MIPPRTFGQSVKIDVYYILVLWSFYFQLYYFYLPSILLHFYLSLVFPLYREPEKKRKVFNKDIGCFLKF